MHSFAGIHSLSFIHSIMHSVNSCSQIVDRVVCWLWHSILCVFSVQLNIISSSKLCNFLRRLFRFCFFFLLISSASSKYSVTIVVMASICFQNCNIKSIMLSQRCISFVSVSANTDFNKCFQVLSISTFNIHWKLQFTEC